MSDYRIPEPKEEPEKALVIYFKVLKGIEFDDRIWDKRHFGRCMAAASELIEVCKDYEQAKRCIDELAEKFTSLDLTWTLETIVKHAHDWRQRRGKKNDIQSRKRFFDALTKQRADGKDMGKGNAVTGREILSPLGNFEVFQSNEPIEDGSPDSGYGGIGEGFQPDTLETKEA